MQLPNTNHISFHSVANNFQYQCPYKFKFIILLIILLNQNALKHKFLLQGVKFLMKLRTFIFKISDGFNHILKQWDIEILNKWNLHTVNSITLFENIYCYNQSLVLSRARNLILWFLNFWTFVFMEKVVVIVVEG